MTQVRRAKNYLVYLVALAISGLFSLLGRPAPSWAAETTADRNATVFQQTMQVAQGTVQNPVQRPVDSVRDVKLNTGNTAGPSNIERYWEKSSSTTRYTYMDLNAIEAKPFLSKTLSINKDVSAAWLNAQNERFNFMVNSIKDKVERGENLSDVELLYFNMMFKDYVEEKATVDRVIAD